LKADVGKLNQNTVELKKNTETKLKKMAEDMEFIKDAVCGIDAGDGVGSLSSARGQNEVANIVTSHSGNLKSGLKNFGQDSLLKRTLPPRPQLVTGQTYGQPPQLTVSTRDHKKGETEHTTRNTSAHEVSPDSKYQSEQSSQQEQEKPPGKGYPKGKGGSRY